MASNRAYGFAGYIVNQEATFEKIAERFDLEMKAACKPLVEAVLEHAREYDNPAPDAILRHEQRKRMFAEARKLKVGA